VAGLLVAETTSKSESGDSSHMIDDRRTPPSNVPKIVTMELNEDDVVPQNSTRIALAKDPLSRFSRAYDPLQR